jgi:hypothetical protein
VTLLYEDEEAEQMTVGIPVEVQLISGGPLRWGATLVGNVNLLRPFAALAVTLQVGRVP